MSFESGDSGEEFSQEPDESEESQNPAGGSGEEGGEASEPKITLRSCHYISLEATEEAWPYVAQAASDAERAYMMSSNIRAPEIVASNWEMNLMRTFFFQELQRSGMGIINVERLKRLTGRALSGSRIPNFDDYFYSFCQNVLSELQSHGIVVKLLE